MGFGVVGVLVSGFVGASVGDSVAAVVCKKVGFSDTVAVGKEVGAPVVIRVCVGLDDGALVNVSADVGLLVSVVAGLGFVGFVSGGTARTGAGVGRFSGSIEADSSTKTSSFSSSCSLPYPRVIKKLRSRSKNARIICPIATPCSK